MAESNTHADLAKAYLELEELEAAAGKLAFETDNPDDERLVAADAALDAAKGRIRRLERIAQGLETRVTDAKRAEFKASCDQAYTDAVRIADERVKLAERLDDAISEVGKLLAEWASVGAACRNSAAFLHREDRATAWQYALLDQASGNNHGFTGALEWALHKIKLGAVGISLDTQPRRPIGDSYSIRDAAEKVAENLRIRLKTCLDQAVAKVD